MSFNGFVSGLVSGLKQGTNIAEAYSNQQDQQQYYQAMQQHWQAQDAQAAQNKNAGPDMDALSKGAAVNTNVGSIPDQDIQRAAPPTPSQAAVPVQAPQQQAALPVVQGQPSQDQFMQALAQTESGGNPSAMNSDTGASGLYQVMPANLQPGQDPNRVGAVMATAAYNAYPDNPTAAYLYHHNGPGAAAQYANGQPVTNAGPQTVQALTNFNKNLQTTMGASQPVQAAGGVAVAPPVTPAGNGAT